MSSSAWRIQLGRYDEDAPSTLPTQLELLHALVDLADPDLSLSYRLGAERDGEDMVVRFQLECTSSSQNAVEATDALDDLASAGLIRGYHLSRNEPPIENHPYALNLRPAVDHASSLPTSSDWTRLIDFLRRRDDAITVNMTCSYTDANVETLSLIFTPIYRTIDDAGAEFLTAIRPEAGVISKGALALSASISSSKQIDSSLASIIGRMLFGVAVRVTAPVDAKNISDPHKDTLIGYPEQMISFWHAPYGHMDGRGVLGSRHTALDVKFKMPDVNGITLGKSTIHTRRYSEDVDIKLGATDRTRHTYIIGKTGSGKTNLIKNIALQDIKDGRGGAVITPHPDLNRYLIENAGDRLSDIVHLDFGDPDFTPLINPLTIDIQSDIDYRVASEEILRIIVGQTYNEFTGPVFEDMLRLVLESMRVVAQKNDLVPSIAFALELLRRPKSREWLVDQLAPTHEQLAEEWRTFNKMLGSTIAEQARWVNAKLSAFGSAGSLANSSTLDSSRLSIEKIYQENKILLVTLPETKLGRNSIEFLGRFFFSRIYGAAKKHTSTIDNFHFLHVDEFQRFVTEDVEELVAEARKFRLAMTLAHQNLRQLNSFSRYEGAQNSRLQEALFTNVGTMIVMKTSGHDITEVAREFQIPERDVRDIAQYQAVVRATIDERERKPFSLRVAKALSEDPTRAFESTETLRHRMSASGIVMPTAQVAISAKEKIKQISDVISGKQPKSADILSEWLAERDKRRHDVTESENKLTTRPVPIITKNKG